MTTLKAPYNIMNLGCAINNKTYTLARTHPYIKNSTINLSLKTNLIHFYVMLSPYLCLTSFFIPRHTLVSGYYVIPFSVCPSVRLCSPFLIDNLSIYSRNFFKFCIHIVIGDEWYGIVNGQNPSIFNGVTALFRIGKMVSGLLFLYCSCYLNETSQICCTSNVTYCDYGPSL